MSIEHDCALEVCGKLEEIRQEIQDLNQLHYVISLQRRERLAAAALQGLLAFAGPEPIPLVRDGLVLKAADYADALITVLAATKDPE